MEASPWLIDFLRDASSENHPFYKPVRASEREARCFGRYRCLCVRTRPRSPRNTNGRERDRDSHRDRAHKMISFDARAQCLHDALLKNGLPVHSHSGTLAPAYLLILCSRSLSRSRSRPLVFRGEAWLSAHAWASVPTKQRASRSLALTGL